MEYLGSISDSKSHVTKEYVDDAFDKKADKDELNSLNERVTALEEEGGSSVTVDTELSETSENAISNSAVTRAIVENEEVTAAALNDLDSRLKDVGSLISGVAVTKEEFQEGIQSITNEIVENEEVHAAALNDLNNRISELAENVQGETITKAEFQSVVDSIKAMILANEEVHAAALNNLNTRISILENN